MYMVSGFAFLEVQDPVKLWLSGVFGYMKQQIFQQIAVICENILEGESATKGEMFDEKTWVLKSWDCPFT